MYIRTCTCMCTCAYMYRYINGWKDRGEREEGGRKEGERREERRKEVTKRGDEKEEGRREEGGVVSTWRTSSVPGPPQCGRAVCSSRPSCPAEGPLWSPAGEPPCHWEGGEGGEIGRAHV